MKPQDPLTMLRCAQGTLTLIAFSSIATKLRGSLKTSHSLSKPNFDGESPLKINQDSSGHPRTITLTLDPLWLVQVMIYHKYWPCHWGPLNPMFVHTPNLWSISIWPLHHQTLIHLPLVPDGACGSRNPNLGIPWSLNLLHFDHPITPPLIQCKFMSITTRIHHSNIHSIHVPSTWFGHGFLTFKAFDSPMNLT